METLLIFFLFLSFSFTYTVLGAENCKPASCSNAGPEVRFPFRLRDHQPQSCGYPGFDLSCNNKSQLVLNLPDTTGEFVVSQINYVSQSIYIEPDFCNREDSIQSPISLSRSPFSAQNWASYTFFNCSPRDSDLAYVPIIDCLSGDNNTVVAIPTYYLYDLDVRDTPSECRNISTLEFPVQMGLQQDFQLTWGSPLCGRCELQGGTCGSKNGAMMEIDCSKPPRHGLPNAAKYGIVIGAGIPGLLCLICLLSYTGSRIKAYTSQRRQQNMDLPTITVVPQPAFLMGLDKPTIESYPMTVLGESKRLPKPNDSTCAICLSEYQPKDTLRTVPECNHYFHANCIDEWLMLNATCPVCRNSPEGSSSTLTPTSSMSSRTSLIST